MTKAHAHAYIPNAGSPAGPHQNADMDKKARLNAMLIVPQPGMLEADRHQYPLPPQRLHKGMTPTGSLGGGHLHDTH